MISSDEHSNIMNDIVNVTSPLTATFSDLRNNTNYDIAVTPYNRVVAGMTTTVNIRTSSPVSTKSNDTNNNATDNPSSNTGGMVLHNYVYILKYANVSTVLECNKVTRWLLIHIY